jgi:hypothetical protein
MRSREQMAKSRVKERNAEWEEKRKDCVLELPVGPGCAEECVNEKKGKEKRK